MVHFTSRVSHFTPQANLNMVIPSKKKSVSQVVLHYKSFDKQGWPWSGQATYFLPAFAPGVFPTTSTKYRYRHLGATNIPVHPLNRKAVEWLELF